MANLVPYINFADRGREAIDFYKTVFGGDAEVQLVKDSGMAANMPPEWGDRIMHFAFTAGDLVFYGSDIISDQAGKVAGNLMYIAVNCDSAEQLHDYFDKLGKDGKTVFAPADSEWGSVFAQCVDHFDVTWMLNFEKPTE